MKARPKMFTQRYALPIIIFMSVTCQSGVVAQDKQRTTTNEYRYEVLQQYVERRLPGTFIGATFSGGGMRAASLAYGALTALRDTVIHPKPGQERLENSHPIPLISEVDFVSSVSGGSVTAAYWALHGTTEKFDTFKNEFLEKNIQGEILNQIVDPAQLAQMLVLRNVTRTTELSRFFSDELYGTKTYRDLLDITLREKDRPYLVVNATDMGTRTMFPFVQLQFDLICDDLGRHTLANAVAASAAYPLVFPALTFINKRVTGVPCARADHYDDIETLVRENRATVETLQSEWILAKSTLDQWNTKVRESQEQIQQGVLELANSKQYAEDLRSELDSVEEGRINLAEILNQSTYQSTLAVKLYEHLDRSEKLKRESHRKQWLKSRQEIGYMKDELHKLETQERDFKEKLDKLAEETFFPEEYLAGPLKWFDDKLGGVPRRLIRYLSGTEEADNAFSAILAEFDSWAKEQTIPMSGVSGADSYFSGDVPSAEPGGSEDMTPPRSLTPEHGTYGERGSGTNSTLEDEAVQVYVWEEMRATLAGLQKQINEFDSIVQDHELRLNGLGDNKLPKPVDNQALRRVINFVGSIVLGVETLDEQLNKEIAEIEGMLHKDAQVDDDREVIIDDVEITRRFERVAESAKKQWEYLIEIGTGVGAYVDMLTYSHGNRVRQSENYSLTAKLSEVEDEIRSKRLALSELQEKWDETLMTLRRELDAAANETKEAYAGRERVTAEVHGLKVDLEQLDEEQQRTIEEYTRAEELVVLKEAKLVERRRRGSSYVRELDKIEDKEKEARIRLGRFRIVEIEHRTAVENYLRQRWYYEFEDNRFVHLIDGGASDNLGFAPLVELLDSFFPLNSWGEDQRSEWQVRTETVAVIVVDARGVPGDNFARDGKPPGFFDTLRTTVNTAIDGKSFILTKDLERMTRRLAAEGLVENQFLVKVDLESISPRDHKGDLWECRRLYEKIPTNWKLAPGIVDALVDVGRALVLNSPVYEELVRNLEGVLPKNRDSVATVCKDYREALIASAQSESEPSVVRKNYIDR